MGGCGFVAYTGGSVGIPPRIAGMYPLYIDCGIIIFFSLVGRVGSNFIHWLWQFDRHALLAINCAEKR